ncbi:MAG: DUF1501 domain-containing protein, partial [Opitutaceae bacterium]
MPQDFPPHSGHACHGISTDLADYFLTRRQLLSRVGMGVGALGLASLIPSALRGATETPASLKIGPSPLLPKPPHFPGKAKAVIHIFAQGAPSHVDTWDPKPTLTRLNNKTLADGGIAMGSPFQFKPYGASGLEISDVFAKTAAHADDLAVIRSMWT